MEEGHTEGASSGSLILCIDFTIGSTEVYLIKRWGPANKASRHDNIGISSNPLLLCQR